MLRQVTFTTSNRRAVMRNSMKFRQLTASKAITSYRSILIT